MHKRACLSLMVSALLLPLQLVAQGRAPIGISPPMHGRSFPFGARLHNPFFHHSIFLAGPAFYPDYPYEPPPVPPPQVVIVQAPAPAAQTKEEPKRVQPLLIEWQGDRFVRIASAEESLSTRSRVPPDYVAELNANARGNSAIPHRELPPALLVFRDGHQEESANYAIVDGVLYAYADYWMGGSWTKRILIADLDLPATLKQNQERGVKFTLPAGPNQVVTRP
jgi:hypothetical protein